MPVVVTTWSWSAKRLNATGGAQAQSNRADTATSADTAARRHCLDTAIGTHSSSTARWAERK